VLAREWVAKLAKAVETCSLISRMSLVGRSRQSPRYASQVATQERQCHEKGCGYHTYRQLDRPTAGNPPKTIPAPCVLTTDVLDTLVQGVDGYISTAKHPLTSSSPAERVRETMRTQNLIMSIVVNVVFDEIKGALASV
jgi:hypothetical protein